MTHPMAHRSARLVAPAHGSAGTLLAALLAVFAGAGCTADLADPADVTDVSLDDVDGDAYEPFDPAGKADGLTVGEPLEFRAACENGEQLTIAAVGDVLIHGRLQKQGFREAEGFASLWSHAADLLASADVTYANLEVPTAPGVNKEGQAVADPGRVFDDVVYSSYPQFNVHPSILDDLESSGVDVVSTANNHSLDRRALGVDRSIDELRARGLAYAGTRKRSEQDAPWYAVTESRGFRLAWVACTFGTNGMPDHHGQVAKCFSMRVELLALVSDLSQRADVDAVIVTPHWGTEYSANPDRPQQDLAHDFLDAGALAVIGSHPHVLQPWEKYVTADGRETFAIYSLGNFVSGQNHLVRRSTLLLELGLTRTSDGDVVLNGARYVPLTMKERPGFLTLELPDRDGGCGESRALTVEMFGLYNLDLPRTAIQTAPQCDAQWQPAHELDGWIGGGCDQDGVCGGAQCNSALPGGMCTVSCDGYCPDEVGRASTFCISDSAGSGGMCVAQCEYTSDCRPGYSCQQRSRHTQPGVTQRVCVPAS